jgi:secondary thiamine-phosphate synthase enzyme
VAGHRLMFQTTGDGTIVDLSEGIVDFLATCDAGDGILTVFVPGSTAGVTTIEFEPGALEDLRNAIERIAPRGPAYAHDRRWGDGNGFSHVRAALLGPSVSIPVRGGRPGLGTWQQVVLCDFDNRPRRRSVLLQFVGSPGDAPSD